MWLLLTNAISICLGGTIKAHFCFIDLIYNTRTVLLDGLSYILDAVVNVKNIIAARLVFFKL